MEETEKVLGSLNLDKHYAINEGIEIFGEKFTIYSSFTESEKNLREILMNAAVDTLLGCQKTDCRLPEFVEAIMYADFSVETTYDWLD